MATTLKFKKKFSFSLYGRPLDALIGTSPCSGALRTPSFESLINNVVRVPKEVSIGVKGESKSSFQVFLVNECIVKSV